MEAMDHVQHRPRSSPADNPRCPAQGRRFDRSKPVTLRVPTRERMRLLRYDPCDSFAYSRSAAGLRCTESFNAVMNAHERASTTCRPGQTGSTRTGLAVRQQFVVAAYIESIFRARVRQIEARAIQKVRRTAHVASARRRKSPKTPAERAKHTLNEITQEAPPRNDCHMAARARGDGIRDAKAACTPAFARSVTATAA
jgi:hypothetical protein